MESESWSVKVRNLAGFWLLGLCNNFGYVVMLSAAHDILTEVSPPNVNGTVPVVNRTGKLVPRCNTVSTGAVLLADVLPTLIIKLTAPFFIQNFSYWFRVAITIVFGFGSFPIVAASRAVWVSLLGVVCASIASGFGEITFLSLSTFFHKDVVSTWSSGTGAAGVFGALSYAGLIAAGVSARNTLFLMMTIPTTLALTYFVLLVKPASLNLSRTNTTSNTTATTVAGESSSENVAEVEDERTPLVTEVACTSGQVLLKGFRHKLKLLVPLLPFMVPLGLVYFAEYFINQGLQELIYFEGIWLPVVQQYRWYQVIYQVGVLISRSSVNCFQIKRLWILPILQMLNVVVLLLQVFYQFLPSIWLVFALILYEGLLGGAAYVNTFYGITQQVKEEDREYSMGVACVADSMGISIAGALSIPVHDLICTL